VAYALAIDSQDRIVVAGDFRLDFAWHVTILTVVSTQLWQRWESDNRVVEYATDTARAVAIDSSGGSSWQELR